jgi:hypothetical protein
MLSVLLRSSADEAAAPAPTDTVEKAEVEVWFETDEVAALLLAVAFSVAVESVEAIVAAAAVPASGTKHALNHSRKSTGDEEESPGGTDDEDAADAAVESLAASDAAAAAATVAPSPAVAATAASWRICPLIELAKRRPRAASLSPPGR